MPFPGFEYSATADAAGKFVFDRVVPGSITVARKIELSDHSYSSANTTQVQVKPDAHDDGWRSAAPAGR